MRSYRTDILNNMIYTLKLQNVSTMTYLCSKGKESGGRKIKETEKIQEKWRRRWMKSIYEETWMITLRYVSEFFPSIKICGSLLFLFESVTKFPCVRCRPIRCHFFFLNGPVGPAPQLFSGPHKESAGPVNSIFLSFRIVAFDVPSFFAVGGISHENKLETIILVAYPI